MKKIVITGISSFIGYHLVRHFINKYKVYGTLSKKILNYNNIQENRINHSLEHIRIIEEFNLKDKEFVKRIIKDIKPDYFIHQAGWSVDYGSFNYDLRRGYEVNVEPLSIIYPALQECGCEGIIITGSSAEYSDSDQGDKEYDPVFPTMPYGLSKLTETLYARQLANKYKVSTRIARVYIPFGEFDAPDKLISAAISSLMKSVPIDLSSCEQKRDFIYIENLMSGYETLLKDFKRDSVFDIFNLASGEATPLKELLLIVAHILNSNPKLLRFGALKMRPGEPFVSFGNNKKAIEKLGWNTKSLQDGLIRYIDNLKVR